VYVIGKFLSPLTNVDFVLIGVQHRTESTDRDALRDVFNRMHTIAMATAQRR
jgi:hypothetical protein